MNIRTDLALESVNATKVRDGITKISRGKAFKAVSYTHLTLPTNSRL